jgi:lysophospholipase L1-like esterase
MILPEAQSSGPIIAEPWDGADNQPAPLMIGRPESIELLVIFLGANDAAIPPSGQHVPLARYQNNLKALVDMVQSPMSRYYSKNTRVVLVTPPPLDESAWAKKCAKEGRPLDRRAATTQKYAETCVKLANELMIPVLDLHTLILEKAGAKGSTLPRNRISSLFSAFNRGSNRSKENIQSTSSGDAKPTTAESSIGSLGDYLVDGLHLGPLGNRVLFEGIVGVIKRAWSDLDPAAMPEMLPDYSSLAANKTEAVRMLYAHVSGEEISALAKGKHRAEADDETVPQL